ncbi:MAG: hypothetical protein E7307_14420 [Butyrivibrio sp.]|nr:hypothetical protein [Butyrivibrio sp.]
MIKRKKVTAVIDGKEYNVKSIMSSAIINSADSLYVVNGKLLMEITGAGSVLEAIRAQGGVYRADILPTKRH